MAEIDSITREALRRASQMHTHAARQSRNNAPPKKPPEKHEPPEPAPPIPEPPKKDEGLLGGVLDNIFKDKDRSIILLLLVLLMGEDCEPSLMLALLYLLM